MPQCKQSTLTKSIVHHCRQLSCSINLNTLNYNIGLPTFTQLGFTVEGLWFRVWGLRFTIQGLWFRVWVWGLGFRDWGLWFRVQCLGFRGLGFRVYGLGFRVQGLGFMGLVLWDIFYVLGLGFRVRVYYVGFRVMGLPRWV